MYALKCSVATYRAHGLFRKIEGFAHKNGVRKCIDAELAGYVKKYQSRQHRIGTNHDFKNGVGM